MNSIDRHLLFSRKVFLVDPNNPKMRAAAFQFVKYPEIK